MEKYPVNKVMAGAYICVCVCVYVRVGRVGIAR